MSASRRFDQVRLPRACEEFRQEVRAFIAPEIAAGSFDPNQPRSGDLHNTELSRRIGAKGWIDMTAGPSTSSRF